MKKLLVLFLLILTFFFHERGIEAKSINEFEIQITNWNKKISLASKYLKQAESALKEGDKYNGCLNQKKAGTLGVEASMSLIKAFEIKGGNNREIENFRNGLNKWKELRDFC